jgi:eukaryotic-like serine/threonine-protein kinase
MMNEVIKTAWKLGNRIGDKSGFGQVYEARKVVNGIEQNEEYVIKKLIQLDDDSIARFKREVRYLTKLDHPRIIKSEGNNLQNEPYFYAMTKYETSLNSIMSQLSTDYQRLQIIFNNILEGIEYLHNEGYYHRDLKPANVLYNSDNDLVLCDLGLCVNSNSDGTTSLTMTHMGAGTRYYCSPEQETDLKNVDQRTDIYSIGKMIYEAFTGNRPLVLDYSQLPPAIQYVIKTSTKENRSDRFETVEELRQHFNTAMELLINGTSQYDLLSVINDINRLEDFDFIFNDNDKIIDQLAQLLGELRGEEQFQEMIMKISGTPLKYLEDKYPDLFKGLIQEFIQSIESQGWPFSYTDTIANKYEEIFINIKDIDTKGELLKGLLSLGTGHNRWFVMHKFITLLSKIEEDAEAHSIYHILSSQTYDLERIENTISIEKNNLHSVLKRLFN